MKAAGRIGRPAGKEGLNDQDADATRAVAPTPNEAAWLESTAWIIAELTFYRQRGDTYSTP